METLRAKDIKPVSNKRKADGSGLANPSSASGGLHSPVGSSFGGGSSTAGPSTSSDGIVLTSAPSVYPQAEQAAAADGEKPVKKFKKIKATKELEKGKNKWQEFNNKSKFAKTQKKDSMFRTPDGPNGRGMLFWPLGYGYCANLKTQLDSLDLARLCARTLLGVVTFTNLMRTLTKMILCSRTSFFPYPFFPNISGLYDTARAAALVD